ncbi:MAG: signal peptidase I [Bacilli bacterium]|nr:signal peptidase I [Bacilli bacterium]
MNKEMVLNILKIVSKILSCFLFLILGICLYLFISLNILSKNYASFFSYTVFQIGSNSMAPTITTNDLILVKISKKIDVDDIITFEDGNVLVTHRVISKTGSGFITKGDANNERDKQITSSQVVGKVVKIFPNMGVWFKVITTPKIIIMICFTLFMFSLAFSYTGKAILTKHDDFGIYYSGIKLKKDGSNVR